MLTWQNQLKIPKNNIKNYIVCYRQNKCKIIFNLISGKQISWEFFDRGSSLIAIQYIHKEINRKGD